jgi:DNA repair protein RecO (recombination protein O)
LQPFQPLWIELSGSGELKLLKQVESRARAVSLQREGLFSGFYMNELLCRLLHRNDPYPNLFVEYERVLPQLLPLDQLDIALRQFELRLLEELGYGLDLTSDTVGMPIDAQAFYRFDPNYGLTRVSADTSMALSGRALREFAAGDYTADARRSLKSLCRVALRAHLGDKPLRSRSLFAIKK